MTVIPLHPDGALSDAAGTAMGISGPSCRLGSSIDRTSPWSMPMRSWTQVMRDRGYPVDDFDAQADLVSVDHPDVVENYREGPQHLRTADERDGHD